MDARNGSVRLPSFLLAAALAAGTPAPGQEEEQDNFKGSVEVLYRSVTTGGSQNKYDEDFDGLESGVRLGGLSFDWALPGSRHLDYVRLDARGLGGDPYQRTDFRLGRKDVFDFSFRNTQQVYLYDLFDLVTDEDGAIWDSERRMTDVSLRIHPAEWAQVFFQFRQGERSGTSLFMKDIERDLFRLETPLDTSTNTYTVGANFTFGPVDVLFRQSLRRYDHQFNNSTEGDLGLDAAVPTQLDSYEWIQNDSGGTDTTTLRVHAPLGKRVNLSVGISGTLLGEEDLESSVHVEQLGLDSSGNEFGGFCAVGGQACSNDASCDAVNPGDVCVPAPGFNETVLEGDTTLLEANLGVLIARPLTLFLEYRSLERDLEGESRGDLDGDGVFDDSDGDGIAGTGVRRDYEINTATATFDYRPIRQLGIRAGFRLIDRELIREGFDPTSSRSLDYDSADDETLIFGLTLRPVDWFRLNADFEDGDIDQPFNAVAPQESRHTRVRAVFTPKPEMRLDLGYLDFEKTNAAPDIRDPGSVWDASLDGTSWSLSFFHEANDFLDYTLRYAVQDVESDVAIVFDQAGFAATETGNSIFDNDNTQILGRIGFRWAKPWDAHVSYWATESDGENLVLGDASGVVNDQPLDQEFTNLEMGLTYTFPSGIFVGGSLRDFDYDDGNDLLDYDGQIFLLRLGTTF